MATRGAPTARRLRLGTELRKLRERAGLTATEAAKRLGVSQAQLSNIEASRFGVSADRVRTLACNYTCDDQAFIEALIDMAGERKGGWWEQYRDLLPSSMLDLAELDHHGTRLRAAYTAHIPGLLQTADHAREIFRQVVPELTPPNVEHRVSHRMKRQEVIYRDSPAPLHAIIHEAALRMQVGGPAVALQQRKHLIEMSEREHITILIIPFSAGAYPGSGQSIYYVHGPVPQLDTVHLDASHGAALVDAEAPLKMYQVLLDRMESVALKPKRSRDFIHQLAQEL